MASALAQQLAQLANVQGPQERYVRGKPSLLFDYQKAADVSAETLLGIAQQGVDTLLKADKRFAPFPETLFSRSSLSLSRDQLTKDENNQLNANLRAFLHVLTNHFLAPAAFQALEYCIRRYEVHVYNVDDLMVCALPYHATPEFARLVALLQLKGTAWVWLGPCQQSGAPPPRELIVRRCVNDQSVLREICKGAQALGVTGFVSKTYLSFYAVLLCEVLVASPQITEETLNGLLPFLVAGLKEAATRDYRAATLMILTQLLSRAQLQRDFLAVIVVEVMRCAADLGGSTALMLLAHLAASQPQLHSIAPRTLQMMVEHSEEAGQQLADLQERGANLQPLLKLLVPSLTNALPQHPQLQPLLLALLTNVTLDAALVESAALQLLQAGTWQQHQPHGEAEQHLQQALRTLDLRYPDQLDAAINKALEQAVAAGADVTGPVAERKVTKHKKGKQQPEVNANSMFEFVQRCFLGTRHEVVPAAQQDGEEAGDAQQRQQALTLSLAVSAPASQMRIMAIQKLDAICAGSGAPEPMQQLLQNSLATCLQDDVFAVASAAASAAGLSSVPAEQQLPALRHLLSRAAAKLAAGSTTASNTADGRTSGSGGKEILGAAKAALAAVAAVGERAADIDAADSEHVAAVQQQAASILLEYVLADKRLKKLARAAVSICCNATWHPLLQAIAAAPAVAAALQQASADAADAATPATSDSKRQKKGSKADKAAAATSAAQGKHAAAVATNRSVVLALADALCSSVSGAALLASLSDVAASCGPRCRHLLLLALLKAVAASAGGAAVDVQPAPSKSKGKHHRHSSSQVLGDEQRHGVAARSARIAMVLLQMLEQALNPDTQRDGTRNLAPQEDWQATADAALDDAQLPTQQHLQHLHNQLPQLQAALLLSGLKHALEAATPDSLAQLLGQPMQLFARVAAAAAAAGTAGTGLLHHLQLLVQKSHQQLQQQLSFLSGFYGLPAASCPEAVQVIALQLLQRQYSSGASGDSSTSSSWFVALLAAVDSSSRAVRIAAVDALLALPEAINCSSDSWSLTGGFTAAHLSALAEALQVHDALLRSSGGALTPLLCSAVAAAASNMDVDSGAGSGKSRATRRSSKAGGCKASIKADAGDGDDAEAAVHAELKLSAGCAAALQQLFVAALPELHGEATVLAARMAVAVLAVGAGANAVGAAAAAQQLFQAVLQALCANVTKAAAAAVLEKSACASAQLPVWQQLAEMKNGSAAVCEAAVQLQQLRSAVAVALLHFYSPELLPLDAALAGSYVCLLQLPFVDAAAAGLQIGSSSGKLSDAQLAAVAPIRTAALQKLDAAMFALLSPEQQQTVFAAVLQTHATDSDANCRAAARSALEQMPVSAGMVVKLLQRACSSPTSAAAQQPPRSKRSKRASTAEGIQQQPMDVDAAAAAAAGVRPVLAADLDAAIAALELLEWKDDIQDKQQLLQPLQRLLQQLIPLMGSIAESHREDGVPVRGEDETTMSQDEQQQLRADRVASASAAGYAAQLALSSLASLVKEQQGNTAAEKVDPSFVLACASAAPDGAVRNAALLLLSVLSQQSPEDVLGHVLQALAVIQQSAAFQADSHSQAVASAALAALVPAWMAAGRGSEELWSSLIAALPGLPANRRLRLLETLRTALPEDAGLRVGLLLLMQRIVAATSHPTAIPASSQGKTPGKKSKKQVAEAVHVDNTAAAASDESEWLPDLMAALCEQVAVAQRLQAFAWALAASLTDSTTGEALPAHSPLPRLAVTFITANLKGKAVLSAAHAATSTAAAAAGTDPVIAAIPEACHSIMAQALMHLQQLNPTKAAAGSSSKGARKLQKAIRAAATGVYDLLAALEAVQDCRSYLLALVQMSQHEADAVQRRALRLLANRLLKAQIDLADLETATATLPAAEKLAKQRELAQAGLAICQELPRLLQAEAPLTRQLALIAADAGMRQFGEMLPGAVLSSLSAVLGAVDDAAAPVRVSALACIAAAVAALGAKVVPLLPQTAATVLSAAQAACKDLEEYDHARQQQQGSGSEDFQQQQQQAADDSHDDDDDAAAGADLSRGEEAALQLAGALAAVEALVSGLHAFMSPYLKQILQLLLHKQVLSCSTAGGADAAARLRALLPAKIPPRLLLDPLVSQWDYAVTASGGSSVAQSAVAMLDLVTTLCGSMEPSVAMKHHEQLLALLLRALDTRHRWLAAMTGQQRANGPAADGPDAAAAAAVVASFSHVEVHAIESAAVAALSALVIKLSESKFKPMFLRMVEWTTAGSSSASAGVAGDYSAVNAAQWQGRAAAFFAAVGALGHRLRAIFAPYYRYFNILLMKHLAGEALFSAAGDKRPKKKHRKSSSSAAAAGSDQPGAEELLLSGWLARLHAIRAVHLLALIEPPAAVPAAVQEQQERFDRLLPLVVDALAEGPPAAIAAVLAVEGADSALDLPGGTVAALGAAGKAAVDAGGAAAIDEQCDIVGTAAVGALLQMAQAAGSDVLWKPLHHAVLMGTRGGGVRAKLLGIGGVSRLADMLREEYLMMLPEALPFISELIEDAEVAVEGAAQGLVAQLEALSGERLEQYLKA